MASSRQCADASKAIDVNCASFWALGIILIHMPTISAFFGIVIRMYYDDHAPPHFHAYYASQAAIIDIQSLNVLEGGLRRRALALVHEWAAQHREELMENWRAAELHEPLRNIDPLE